MFALVAAVTVVILAPEDAYRVQVLTLLLCFSSIQGDAAHEPRNLSELIRPVLEKSGLPALGGAIVTSAGIESIGAVGLRAWGASELVTRDDQWHLGSCTKGMTATLVARLVDRGVLSWATTIGDVFGKAVPKMDPSWKDVSILSLLCHRSGASRNFTQELWDEMEKHGGSPREQRRLFVQDGLAVAPDTRPNTETIYSNAGFMIAGAMLEELADASWEDLMRREVFEPLGMTQSGFGPPGVAGRLDQPLGHTRGEQGWTAIQPGPSADNPVATGPAGTVHATLADWARFARAHLRGERGDESYLKMATWKRLHSPPASDAAYAPGWLVADEKWAGGALLKHLGSNNLWVCEISLALEEDFAVLVVTNVGDDAAERPFKDLVDLLVADHSARTK